MSKSCPFCVRVEREVKAEGGDRNLRQGRRQRNIDGFFFLGGKSGRGGSQPSAVQKCISSAVVLRQRRESWEAGADRKCLFEL